MCHCGACVHVAVILAAAAAGVVAFLPDGPSTDGDTEALPTAAARAFYDGFGILQDYQEFFEGPPTNDMAVSCGGLLKRGDNTQPEVVVVEYGYGTGALAEKILEANPSIRYVGVDISPTMHGHATARLADRFGDRATLLVSDDPPAALEAAVRPGSASYAVSAFVFDLMPEAEAVRALATLRRLLRPSTGSDGGLLCLASLTSEVPSLLHGGNPEAAAVAERDGAVATVAARAFAWTWHWLWRRCPACMGGCRPISLDRLLAAATPPESAPLHTVAHRVRATRGFPSEVVVAACGERNCGQ